MEPIENHFDIGGYGPIKEPMALDAILTFADKTGRQCRVEVAGVVAAFLDMDTEGLIPDPGSIWRARFRTLLDPAKRPAQPNMAGYTGLERVDDSICECCGAECHATFAQARDRFSIERWAIVTTVILLTRREMLPTLPFEWYGSLGQEYERICETGRRAYRPGAGVSQNV